MNGSSVESSTARHQRQGEVSGREARNRRRLDGTGARPKTVDDPGVRSVSTVVRPKPESHRPVLLELRHIVSAALLVP